MIMIRTVPNIMKAYACSAEVAQRFIDLRDEGYGREQAKLMAGLADPPDPDPIAITDPHAGVLGHASEDPELLRQCIASGQVEAAAIVEHAQAASRPQLLPCPFCRGITIVRVGCHMTCWSCGCEGREADHATDEAAAEAWNRRDGAGAPDTRRPLGCALAMRVMQSNLYPTLDDTERADCDELIRQNLDWCKPADGVKTPDGAQQ